MKKKLFCSGWIILLLLSVFTSNAQTIPQLGRSPIRLIQPANSIHRTSSTLDTMSCANDSVVLTRQSQVDSFPITHPNCNTLRFVTVNGQDASPAITNLDSLIQITTITRDLFVQNTSITSLSGLANLDRVEGLFWVNDNPSLTHFGINAIKHIGYIIVYNDTSLTSFAGLTDSLVDHGLGTFICDNNNSLTDLHGLEGMSSVPNMYIAGNPNLTSLHGIEGIQGCDGGISLWGNPLLTDISQLSNVTDMSNGTLECSYNYSLTNLTGLHNINLIGHGFWMIGNTSLTTLNQLDSILIIENLPFDYDNHYDSLQLFDNTQLAFCSFGPICNYLASGMPSDVHNNATGCNDTTEIKATCGLIIPCAGGGILKTWTGNEDGNWIHDGNWEPFGKPGPCDSVVIPGGLVNYPGFYNENIYIGALTMEEGSSIGVYFYDLYVNGNVNIYNAQVSQADPHNVIITNSTGLVHIEGSTVAPNIIINNYSGALELLYNTFYNNVSISDKPTRTGDCRTSGNYFANSFSVSAITDDNFANNFLSENDDDYIQGDASLTCVHTAGFYVQNTFNVGGNLTINSDDPQFPYIYNMNFVGSSNTVHIKQLGTVPITFHSVSTNAPGGIIIPDQDVFVDGSFGFGSGIIKTDSSKMLVFKNNAYIYQTSSGSWVNGPLKKIGNQSFNFPVGDSLYQGDLSISAPSQSTDEYVAEYFHIDPNTVGYNTSSFIGLDSVSNKEYWRLRRTNGTSQVKVSLSYVRNQSLNLNSAYAARVAQWNAGQSRWQNEGVSNINITGEGGFVTSSNNIAGPQNIFTIGANNYKPVITISTTDSVKCSFQSYQVNITVDSPLYSGNTYIIQLSDSSGQFNNNLVNVGFFGAAGSTSMFGFIPSSSPAGTHYRIRVISNAPADTSVNTRPMTIRNYPAFDTIVGPSVGCVGSSALYTSGRHDTGVVYTWLYFTTPVSINAHGDSATVTYTNAGPVYLNLRGSNFCGLGFSAQKIVDVYYPPPSSAPNLTNTGRWLFASVPPIGQHTDGYHWYKDNVLINGQNNNSYYASQAGNYKVEYYTTCGTSPQSNVISFVANSIPQTINFPPLSNKTYGDAPFAVNATASSGLPVSFNIVSGPGNIPGNIYNITGTGNVTIRATQAGDNTYDTAAPVTQSFTVNKASQTITFPAIADKDYKTTTSFTASASSNSGLPISYSVISGPATVSGSNITLTGLGTVTLRASQAGDANYFAATPVDISFCVCVSALNAITGPLSICPGINATYMVNNISGATYTWRIAGGATLPSTTNSVTTIWPSPGTYTLIVSAVGNCGIASINDSLTIIAIASAQPDSVHSMQPANGAINQQLPLTLSWIPFNPNLFYTYDVYIWKSDTTQPSTPYVSGLTTVNYTIPLFAAGLIYNHTYNWMVVAHNGSCTVQTAGPIQQFTLIPLPDLEVYNVTSPATAFSGQAVSVTWKVKNNGPGITQVNQSWTDAVYISADSVLGSTTFSGLSFPNIPLLAATKPNVSSLNVGQSYNDTATFTIPISYSGPLYMHVVANYSSSYYNPLIEVTKANDTAHSVTAVTLSPAPDLRVDTILNPNNTFSGSTINVVYKVKNYGANASPYWFDHIYISKDAVFNINTATQLNYANGNGAYFPQSNATIFHNQLLQQDSSYTVSAFLSAPNFIFGQYYIYVFTNKEAYLYEGPNGGNNVNHGNLMQVFLTPTPQLTPVSLNIPSTISTAQNITVGWNTYNQGGFDNIEKNLYPFGSSDTAHPWGLSEWYDKAFLSRDSSSLNTNTSLVINNQRQYNAILPLNNYPVVTSWPVPDTLTPGDYWLYVYDNITQSVFEYPGTPIITRSSKVTVVRPDLTVPSVNVPTTGNSGQPILVSYTILNTGAGDVGNRFRKDYFYLGNNSSFDGTAVLFDSAVYALGSAPSNVEQLLQKQSMLPNGVSGSKFIFVRANAGNIITETNFNNNTNTAGVPINISLTPAPDLQAASIVITNPAYAVLGIPFKYNVNNIGAGTASGSWTDSIFISCNPVFSPAASYFAGARSQQLFIPAAGNYSDSFSLKIPFTFFINNSNCFANDTAQVYFFVKVNADHGLYEVNVSNNVAGSALQDVINPVVDHIVTNVSSADSAAVGRYFKIGWTVKNIGLNPADNSYTFWWDGVYLSTDSILSSNDQLLGYKGSTVRLNHNQSYSDSANYLIPAMPTGDYYLLAKSDFTSYIQSELNKSNNSNVRRNISNQPIKVYISNPAVADLVDTILSAPATVALGQPITIVYKVTNIGAGATYIPSISDVMWLSNSFQEGGLFLGTKTHNGILLPGQSYIDSISTTIPLNYTASNYVLVARTNYYYSTLESNANNNLGYQFISVFAPVPTDLFVTNIAVADTVTLGYGAPVNWVLSNIGNGSAIGTETDGIYLGRDSILDTDNDVLIGTKINQLNILPLHSTDISAQSVTGGLTEGSYYLKVKTDILNNILETDKLNNTTIAGHKVYIKVKNLAMNVITPDTLTPSYLYYKLVVPHALSGKTISVKLTTNDSLTANNQMYIGLGYIPTAAHFDYTYSNPNAGNQQIIIENATDSVYYIALKGTKPNASFQLIRLLAVQLPFSITSVNASSGGNTGNVTIQIRGSLFTTNMVAKIRGISLNNTITTTAVYFVNGTTVYATFNLQGAPLGLYDVTLTKPDLSTATLASGFTIVLANNGGLITGTNTNSGQTGSGNTPGCDPGATSGLNSQLQTEIIIPPKVFSNWPFTIQINYTNASNVDIPAQVRILYSLDGAPISLTPEGIAEGKTTLYLEFKDENGPPGVIRAGGTGTLKIYSKSPAGLGGHALIHFNLQ